eukprot:9726976-Heterocapsa_arctica.AAC.1
MGAQLQVLAERGATVRAMHIGSAGPSVLPQRGDSHRCLASPVVPHKARARAKCWERERERERERENN